MKPEGFMMETFEGVHRTYFANTGKSTNQKNNAIRKEFEKLLEREEEELFKELYNVKCTFGITNPVNHDQVVAFIDGELNNMDWYLENDHYEIALSIPGYIVGYCLFNYAIPKPDRDFFHLYFRIIEEKYFKALGFKQSFQDENGLPSRREIRRAIDRLVDLNERKFPNLEAKMNLLNYDSLPKFAKSYLLMMKEFNLSKPH